MFMNHTSNLGFWSRIHKECLKLNSTQSSQSSHNPLRKGQRSKDTLEQSRYTTANQYTKEGNYLFQVKIRTYAHMRLTAREEVEHVTTVAPRTRRGKGDTCSNRLKLHVRVWSDWARTSGWASDASVNATQLTHGGGAIMTSTVGQKEDRKSQSTKVPEKRDERANKTPTARWQTWT